MATSTYNYDGKSWKPCPTTSGRNSFFHSVFGKCSGENTECFDKQTNYKRRFWGAFLTYVQDINKRGCIKNILKESWSSIEIYKNASVEDPSSFENYVLDVMDAKHEVVMGEIPILATLLNLQIVVLSVNEPNPIIIRPDVKILCGYPKIATGNKAVLCLDGNTFSRLEPLPSNDPIPTTSKSDAKPSNELHSGVQKSKKRGDAGAKGAEYQVGILTVFLLNAFLQELKGWRLSTEDQEIEGFDDAVLKWDGGAVSLQAKHRENKSKKVTEEDLISTDAKKNDFSLPKYFLAYQKNKEKGIKNVIICTNVSIEEKVLNYVKYNNIHKNSKLFYKNGNYTYYTFDYDNKDFPSLLDNIKNYYKKNYQNKGVQESAITEDNIKDFLDRLECYCNYPPTKDIMKVVKKLLFEAKQRKLLHGQISTLELYHKVGSWLKRKKDFCLNETYAKAMFSEICKDIHTRRLEKYDVSIETNFDFQDFNKFHHVTVKSGSLLQEIKVVQTLQQMGKIFLFVNLDDGIGELQQALEAFKLPLYKYLVLVWSQTHEEYEVGNLIDILNKCPHKDGTKVENKEVILIAQSIETLNSEIKQNCNTIAGRVTFEDFSKNSQSDLLTRNVKFQGKKITLKDLCGAQEIEWFKKALDADVLERLVRRELIDVGVQVAYLRKDISPFYINRVFKRTLTKETDNESFGSNTFEETFSEEALYNVSEKVIVISDIAGMGKSTVLTSLAGLIKKQHPELWVIKINLNKYTRILSEYVRKNKQSKIIEELLNSITETTFKNDLENQLFFMQGKVILMLDGIDEISPYYTTPVIDMLVQCQQEQNFHKILLTTRPHLSEQLESKLNVKPFNLQPFTKENQIDFFAKFWTHNLELNQKEAQKCKQYATELLNKFPYWSMYSKDDFSAIPQHLQMLAEIFQEKNSMGTFGNWQGCQEFVRTDNSKPELPNVMDVGILYKMFIEKKRKLFLQRENPSELAGADQALIKQFEECLIAHRKLALEIIVGERKCNLFSRYISMPADNVETMETLYKIGIVQKVGDSWHFVHNTFAEYFAAQIIIEELKCHNQNIEFQKFFIQEILINTKYIVTRAFLNNFLNSILDELPAYIFKSYQSVHSLINLKQREKFEVIHRLAGEGCVAILKLLLKCIKVKTIGGKLVEMTKMNKVFNIKIKGVIFSNFLEILKSQVRKEGVDIKDENGRTPLLYAILNNRLETVKFLVEEKHADIRAKNDYGFSIPYSAIYYNRQEIVYVLFNKMLEAGLNPNDGLAMFTAAYLGDLDFLTELVDREANVKCIEEEGETLIFAAVRGRQLETIKYLVSQGVDINSKDSQYDDDDEIYIENQTALHLAIKCDFLDVVEVLVDCGAELNIEDNRWRTPLSLAAFCGRLDIVKFLVDRGASLCYESNTNYSKVMEDAILGCSEDIVKYLLGLGLDIMARDEKGRTVLHWAAYFGYLDGVQFIMQFKVNVNVKDDKGNTPLHLAAFENHKDIFVYLVEQGSDVNAKNDEGVSPQDLFNSI